MAPLGERVNNVPAAVLAIDGGNSKTDLVLLSTAGVLLSTERSGPFQPQLSSAAAAVGSFAPAVDRALSTAGHPTLLQVSAYLANADLPIETAEIRDAIVGRGWSDQVTVENDTFAVLRAGTERGFGVAVVCGAGINCVGINPSGRQLRFPALGQLTGDWGGGQGLAEEAMWWAVRAEDGRGPETVLSRRVAAHFGEPMATDVAAQFHLKKLDAVRLHEIVPILFDAATAGDDVSLAIVGRQAEEIVALVSTTMRRLDLATTDTDVVLGGGILASNDPVLMEPLKSQLRESAPSARVRLLRDPPVVGASTVGTREALERSPGSWATRSRASSECRARGDPQDRVESGPTTTRADDLEELEP